MIHQLSGLSVIIQYSGELAEVFAPAIVRYVPVLISIERLVVSLGAIYLLQLFGRKTLLTTFIFVLFWCTLGMTIGFMQDTGEEGHINWLIIISIIVFFLAFANSLGPIMWMYLPEIVQPDLVAYAVMTYWTACCSTITFFPMIR